jgi:hypothetical protein
MGVEGYQCRPLATAANPFFFLVEYACSQNAKILLIVSNLMCAI